MARRRGARDPLLPRRGRRLHARGARGRRHGHRLRPRDLAASDGARDACRTIMARDEHPCRSEEHTSELQSLMRTSYAVFCLKKKTLIHIHYFSPPYINNTYHLSIKLLSKISKPSLNS